MLKLTDKQEKCIKILWASLDHQKFTAQALARLFTVYPWTTRLFTDFKGRYGAGDPGVLTHATNVKTALCTAIWHWKNIGIYFSELSRVHQEIGVDNQNVKLLGQTFIVELAVHYQKTFGSEEHEAAYKFFDLVAEALSSNYH